MGSTELEPAPSYAAQSLKERMIQRILEREDLGFTRWTPVALYDDLSVERPDLYPPGASAGLLAPFYSQDFMDELEDRRFQRRISQLPAHMLADSLGRRLLDCVVPLLFGTLDKAGKGEDLFDKRELRMLLKDSLALIERSEVAMAGGRTGGSLKDQPADGVTFEEARQLLARVRPERRQAIANRMGVELMRMLLADADEPIDVEADER